MQQSLLLGVSLQHSSEQGGLQKIIDRAVSRNITRNQALELLKAIGPIGAFINIIAAIDNFREAAELERRAQEIERRGNRLGRELLSAVDTYNSIGCGVGV